MKYIVKTTKRFDKDLKRCAKRGLNMHHIQEAMLILSSTGTLPMKYRSYKLSCNRDGQWECHIETDWLMTWEQNNMELTLPSMKARTK